MKSRPRRGDAATQEIMNDGCQVRRLMHDAADHPLSPLACAGPFRPDPRPGGRYRKDHILRPADPWLGRGTPGGSRLEAGRPEAAEESAGRLSLAELLGGEAPDSQPDAGQGGAPPLDPRSRTG